MNWHVSCAITSDGKGNFVVSFYNHLFNSCSQDWFSVLSILENLLITVRSSNPKVKKAYLKSDEAGCYHNSQLIVAARDVGERVGVSLQRYDFSEPQSGTNVCDRILCPLKGAIRRLCNEGHDVLTASDMHTALKERPVRGCTAAVCLVNETKKDLDIKKIQQFSAMHDFSYQQDGLRVWKAFQIGPGKLIPWDEIYIKHQGATDLTTEQENFGFTPRVTHGSAHDNGDAESGCDLGKCWNAQNQHVPGHSNLSKTWSCTYLLDNIQRVSTTNSNEAGLKNSHPFRFQKMTVPMLSRDRVANLSSRM